MSRMQEATVLFQANITPHRSLSERGLRTLLLIICVMCGASASLFVWLGAWPVGGFTGIELLLAALLFRLHARSAKACELVILTPDSLRIIRTSPDGKRQERTLPPSWLTARLVERPGRVSALVLTTHGREEEIAAALGEEEKRNLQEALAAALYRYRNPVFDNHL